MTETADRDLIEAAKRVREHAYAPHSGFKVGAAVCTRSGKVFVGCNVENASFGATSCAERNAIAAMVAAGERELDTIVVYADRPEPTTPCGICRQVIYEFGPSARVIAAGAGVEHVHEIGELLPAAFGFSR